MPGPEAAIERRIRREAIAEGWIVRKVVFPGTRGAPDRLFGKGRRHVFVEFKAPGQVPTRQQLLRHRELREAFGFRVEICDDAEKGRMILGLGVWSNA